MAETTTETTIAEELREAAARVRRTATGTSGGPWRIRARGYDDGVAVVAENGRLTDGFGWADAGWIALASPLLAEPLASWLEKTAEDVAKAVYEDEICDIPGGSKDQCEADCRGHDPVLVCDECGNLLAPTSPRQGPACSCWTAALATARVLNGTAS